MEPMADVTRSDLTTLLCGWRDGRISVTHVHEWAEARYAVSEYEPADGVVNEILAILDMLDLDPLRTEDASALLAILGSDVSDPDRARAVWDAYLEAKGLKAASALKKKYEQ
jgi:hypothetical protein